MTFSPIIASTGEWLHGTGPHSEIVVSSRVRLARNLEGKPFPGWAKKPERLAVMEALLPVIGALPEMASSFSEKMENLTLLEKQMLVERHLISHEHAAKSVGGALVMNAAQTLSFMINEEDHLRMQAIRSGLQLHEAFAMINQTDSELEEVLPFAFHHELGYLTACPSNVGTGMRASVMLHLPGLVISDQINKVINAVNKITFAVRGIHGEGTDAIGNLFQVSNQITLGESEEEIINRLHKVVTQILQHEKNARTMLLQQQTEKLLDQVGRAYGILFHAHSIATKEALNLLSFIKMGIDLHLFPDVHRLAIDELFIETQPAHLQKSLKISSALESISSSVSSSVNCAATEKMTSQQRDSLRAVVIQKRLQCMPAPCYSANRPNNV
ncbi:MAG TPA: protein arginine kinase [Chthoniobacterales bacterium]|nr:protein arginine kinase [Chthoniobacterales bacterium]